MCFNQENSLLSTKLRKMNLVIIAKQNGVERDQRVKNEELRKTANYSEDETETIR